MKCSHSNARQAQQLLQVLPTIVDILSGVKNRISDLRVYALKSPAMLRFHLGERLVCRNSMSPLRSCCTIVLPVNSSQQNFRSGLHDSSSSHSIDSTWSPSGLASRRWGLFWGRRGARRTCSSCASAQHCPLGGGPCSTACWLRQRQRQRTPCRPSP